MVVPIGWLKLPLPPGIRRSTCHLTLVSSLPLTTLAISTFKLTISDSTRWLADVAAAGDWTYRCESGLEYISRRDLAITCATRRAFLTQVAPKLYHLQ